MTQTETNETNSSDERIRKIYAKDLKVGEVVHTVFRAAIKAKHTSRGGKSYLTLTLVDRTGEVDGRVFENVDAADQAFSLDDYLLVKGKVGQFQGKTQIVVDRLERLDPGPIDAAEFAFTPAPAPAHEPKPAREPREPREAKDEAHPKPHLSRRLARLLENPQIAQALETFVAHLERSVEERVTGKPAVGPKVEKKPRPPREPRAHAEGAGHKPEHRGEHKPEPKRDPSLPEGLAFKPLTALIGEDGAKPTDG